MLISKTSLIYLQHLLSNLWVSFRPFTLYFYWCPHHCIHTVDVSTSSWIAHRLLGTKNDDDANNAHDIPFLSAYVGFSIAARKWACLSLVIISGILLVLQIAAVLLWTFDRSQEARDILQKFSIERYVCMHVDMADYSSFPPLCCPDRWVVNSVSPHVSSFCLFHVHVGYLSSQSWSPHVFAI